MLRIMLDTNILISALVFRSKTLNVLIKLLATKYSLVLCSRDKDDEKVLHSAIAADVDVLITGDNDFSDIDIARPEILSLSEFLNEYS